MTSNTGKDTVDNSSLQRLKTAEDAKLANSQQKMQSKLNGSKINTNIDKVLLYTKHIDYLNVYQKDMVFFILLKAIYDRSRPYTCIIAALDIITISITI